MRNLNLFVLIVVVFHTFQCMGDIVTIILPVDYDKSKAPTIEDNEPHQVICKFSKVRVTEFNVEDKTLQFTMKIDLHWIENRLSMKEDLILNEYVSNFQFLILYEVQRKRKSQSCYTSPFHNSPFSMPLCGSE